jgi:hypothetical protein
MPEQRTSGRATASPPHWGDYPQEKFVAILNNAAKGQKAPQEPVRDRGFVVLARNTESLQVVQRWCLLQSWNDCLTARYRIKPKHIFGTLFMAFSVDSYQMQTQGLPGPGKHPELHGSVLFQPAGNWPDRIQRGLFDASDRDTSGGAEEDKLPVHAVLRSIEKMLTTGRRLVLLVEVVSQSEHPGEQPDLGEWEAAKTGLFELLPERMGLVLAGAPVDFSLPESDQHYLDLDLAGVQAPSGDTGTYTYQLGALASDRPSRDDRLGVQRYADALAQFALHPGTAPLTVAIHGPWGKGKSTFMQLVQRSLLRYAAASADRSIGGVLFGADGQPQRPDWVKQRAWKRALREIEKQVVTVRFNAWRFQDSTQIWAGLASVITCRLEAALSWWRRLLAPIMRAWQTRRAQLITELVLPGVAALLILILAAFGIQPLVNWLDSQLSSNTLAKLLGAVVPAVGAVVASFWIVWSQTRRVLQPVSERILTYIRSPDYRERMGYQNQVLDDVRFVTRCLRDHKTEPRVFVFIDDLDRCPTDTVMEILQAINLILGESDFYVFLGIDTEMIYGAIDAHYAADGRPLPGRRFAETYLQKIIQLPFYLPETPERQRASFVTDLFSEDARKGAMDSPNATRVTPSETYLEWDREALIKPDETSPKPTPDTPTELRAFLDFLPYFRDNPRDVKRLVNVHRFVKIALQGQGRSVPEEIQRKLVKWLIFCDQWPDLVDDVLGYASKHPTSDNPIENLSTPDSEAAKFASMIGPEDTLTGHDLTQPSQLAQAASISHLVAWKSAERASEDKGSMEA